MPPNGGYTGFSFRGAYTHNLATWLQGAGYRTIHIGKFLNGYGDEPFDDGTDVPPGLERLAHGPQGRHRPLLLRLHAERQRRRSTGPSATPAAGKRANTASATTSAAQRRRSTASPASTRPTSSTASPTEEMLGDAGRTSPSTCSSTTPPRTATSAARPGPEPATRHYDTFAGAPYPHSRAQGFNEGNVNDKPRFIREAPYLSPTDIHTYRVYYQKALESLRSIDEGVKQIVDTLGALHRLRNTYVIFTSDNGFFYGEHRLTGGKFLAYEPSTHLPLPDPRPGDQAGHRDRRAGGQHRHRADDPRTRRGRRRTKASTAARSSPTCTTRPCARRRPLLFESFVETNDVEENGGPTAQRAGDRAEAPRHRRKRRRQRLDRRPAEGLRRDPPRPLQVHRVARRREGALRHHQGPLRAQQHRPRPQLLPDPRLPPQPAGPPRDLRRPHLPGSRAANSR